MNLRIKLFGPITVFTLLLAGYLTLYWLPHNTKHFVDSLHSQLEAHISDVGDSLVPSLLNNDLATTHKTLNSLLEKNPSWRQIILINADNQRVFPLSTPTAPINHTTHVIKQIIMYNDSVIGNISLTVDLTEDLDVIYHEKTVLNYAILAGLVIFVLVTVFIVEIMVRRPIRLLSKASGNIRKGDYDIKIPHQTNDEIGKLIGDFGSMRNAIIATQTKLEDKTRELSEILDKTTDAYFTLNPAWQFTYFNRRTQNLFDADEDMLIGNSIWDALDEFSSSFYTLFHRAQHENIPVSGEGYYPPLDKWFEAHIYPLDNGFAIYLRDTTERRKAESELSESEALKHAILDNVADGIVTINTQSTINTCNKSAENIFGYSESELQGKSVSMLIPEHLASQNDDCLSRQLRSNIPSIVAPGKPLELQGRRKDGSFFPMEITISNMNMHDSRLIICTMRDISDRKKQQESLRLANKVFESSIEGIIITDTNNHILRVNKAYTDITGYREEDVLGKNPKVLSSGIHDRDFYTDMWKNIVEKGFWQGEIWNKRKGGEIYPEYLAISTVKDVNGNITNHVGAFTDISEKKQTEEYIEHLANHDPLTGLVNRRLFNDRLQQALLRAQRYNHLVAVLYIDLDRFKTINDTLGHPTGDALLKNIAERLQNCLRENDTVSRIGGDEFIIMLPEVENEKSVLVVAEKIMQSLIEPHNINNREIFTTTSIGIALYPRDADNVDDIIKYADTALYRAKENGRNAFQFYTAEMNASSLERLNMENSLRHALQRNEFILYYQPQVDITSGAVVGVEALLRWQHQDLGLLPPDQFIPLLEETGLIIPVGEWILRTACEQNKAWQDAGHAPFRIAVNISPLQIKQPSIVSTISRVLQQSMLEPQWLELEITEGSIMSDAERNITTLNKIKDMGVHLAIDDFGTGYSSLSYLKRFPIDVLKIDKSFVRDIMTDMDDAAIITAIIALAGSLDLKVIAEGVEDIAQQNFLRSHQCNLVQGYFINRPAPADVLEKFLLNKASA